MQFLFKKFSPAYYLLFTHGASAPEGGGVEVGGGWGVGFGEEMRVGQVGQLEKQGGKVLEWGENKSEDDPSTQNNDFF